MWKEPRIKQIQGKKKVKISFEFLKSLTWAKS